ncbi:MAG: hypothetical protein LBR08_11835 [Bacteroidales bacterium]|jgi:hypothetical protein|nr:hypothetical protein [Bacteroidales bacterium]
MIKDFFDILSECISLLGAGQWTGVLTVSFVLAILCWVICVYYTKLWNKRFHVKAQHHLICGIAVALTFLFSIGYYAFGNLENIVLEIVDEWEEELVTDGEWSDATFEKAWLAVEEVNPAAFLNVPQPGDEDSYIPFTSDEMQQTCITTYVDAACESFKTDHPYLNTLIHAEAGLSEEVIDTDVTDFFNNNPGSAYLHNNAIALAAEHIRDELILQAPGTVTKTRLLLVLLFLLIQLIPFGWIGYCAYQDLHIRQQTIY